jgi:hypothetical protein
MRNSLRYLAAALVLLVGFGWLTGQPASPSDPLEEALQKARVNGKYQMLLRQIKAPQDEKEYGAFKDLGYQARSEYAGQTKLPSGHWVYVAPYWYIWRDLTATVRAKRQWGPEQAAGPPDTWPRAGDFVTAWASLGEDDQDEWLLLEYAEPVKPQALIVYATYNPGAISRVSVFKLDGEEVEVWKGIDPTPVGSGKGISVIPFRVSFKTNRVKIELRSKEVSGWNEIDAVGLRAGGKVQWATAVDASSTYATVVAQQPVPEPDVDAMRLDKLEKDVRDLKDRLKKLEERIKKRKSR